MNYLLINVNYDYRGFKLFKQVRGEIMTSLNIRALALSFATIWGLTVLFLGITSMFGWGIDIVAVLGTFYLGYAPTILGAIIGTIWAFVNGIITAMIFGYLYRAFSSRVKSRKVVHFLPMRKRRKMRRAA